MTNNIGKKLPLSTAITCAPAILFAGAGASVPLELYTAQQFPKSILNFANLDDSSKRILCALEEVDPSSCSNIETLISSLMEIRSDSNLTNRFLLESDSPGLSHIPRSEIMPALGKLTNSVLTHTVQHYSKVEPERSMYLYMWLMFLLKYYPENWHPIPVFTTNYDWAFESMVETWRKPRLIDGFKASPTGLLWNPDIFHRFKGSQRRYDIVLFKLHGSTSWFKLPSNEIAKLAHAEKDPGHLSTTLIYPGFVKEEALVEEPFATAYKYLKACLSQGAELCLIIGFSFSDEPINMIFRRAVKSNPKLHLIIVDPNPDKQTIMSELSLEGSRVTFVEQEFVYYGMDANKQLYDAIVGRMSPNSLFLGKSP